MTRISSALSSGLRPVRALFVEEKLGQTVKFTCRLCQWVYLENVTGFGWALTPNGLLQVVKHMRNHTL